ncbi:hypothetical protein TNCV_2376961 [Trichonephila clavipes]|nr:hypothetical protein TNCV_2376961 [Trichonephila clavipes]
MFVPGLCSERGPVSKIPLRAVLAACHPTLTRDLVACAAARGSAHTPEESTVNNSDGKRRKAMRLLSNRAVSFASSPAAPRRMGLRRFARGLLATDRVNLNHDQVTRTTPELTPPSPNFHTTGGRLSLHRFNVQWPLYTAGLQRH